MPLLRSIKFLTYTVEPSNSTVFKLSRSVVGVYSANIYEVSNESATKDAFAPVPSNSNTLFLTIPP